jgi:hypothetical protein
LEEKNEVVAKCDHLKKLKFSKSLPFAFSEHGVLMAATILNTSQAVEVSVFIIRAFIRLRQAISEYKDLVNKIAQIERQLTEHDDQLIKILDAFKQLLKPDLPKRDYRIGFQANLE